MGRTHSAIHRPDGRCASDTGPVVRRLDAEKGLPKMTYVIVGGLALVAVGLVASQLFRLKDWLDRQPIPQPSDPDQPDSPDTGAHP